LAAKGIKTKYNSRADIEAFKAKWRGRRVTKEDYRKQAKKAIKIGVFGIDDGKFKPMELIVPSQKNEAEVAKAIYLRLRLRRQNKEKLKKAKTPEERARIRKEMKENDRIEKRLRK
jgi:hypothetical protein